MFEFNLHKDRFAKQPDVLFDASRFSVEISPEEVAELKELSPRELQERLDQIFPQDRREQMIAQASEDPSGRKVRYYRSMTKDRFFQMLERGEDISKPEEISPKEVQEKLIGLLESYASFLTTEHELDDDYEEQLWDACDTKDIDLILKHLIPNITAADKEALLACESLESVRDVIKDYLPNKFKQKVHGGSLFIEFTDYVSMSVGGIIKTLNPGRNVYVEIIMDDQDVIIPTNAAEGEKEVLAKSIKLDNISRVFATNEPLISELVEGEDSAIKQAVDASPIKPRHIGDPIDAWRWGTRRNDYLPKSLQAKAAKAKIYGYNPWHLEKSMDDIDG